MSHSKFAAAIAWPIAFLEVVAAHAAFAQTPVAQAVASAASGTTGGVTPATVTITATRGVATALDRTAAAVSVITAQDIEDQDATDVKDALRYEPGVEVRRQAYRPTGISGANGRAGNEGINIRGLEGNQVLMLQDGVSLPQSFAFGSGAAGRGDYLATDLYERIEVLQGPTSAQYGSDGLTGAVNFVTRDPADLLAIHGGSTYYALRSSYDSTDHSWGQTATAAFDGGSVQGLLIVGTRHGHATDNRGSSDALGATRSTPDPLKYDSQTTLGKLVFHATPRDTFKLTAQTLANDSTSDGLSQLGGAYQWSGYIATSYVTANTVTSDALKLDYEHRDAANPWWQSVQASAYWRGAGTRQNLDIAGANAAGANAVRTRVNRYGDDIVGGSVVVNSAVDGTSTRQQFTWGLDGSVSRFRTSSSAGAEWAPNTGYPEAFPKTTETVLGLFAQDDIRWQGLSVVPGLRFDGYRMTPHVDATYGGASSGSTQPTTSSHDHALSPRLSVLYEVTPAFVPYVQYAHGFRAPSAYQVNSYYNPVGSYGLFYQQVGNPDLKPETSNSIELGLRGRVGSGALRYSAAAFSGQYRGFIDTKVIGGDMTSPTDPYTVQYVNYAKASIHGVEAKAEWDVLAALTLKGGVAAIKGTETRDDAKTGLASVPPLALVLGATWRGGDAWFAGIDLTHNAAKKTADLADPDEFATPAFTVVDLHAGYSFNPHIRLTAGVDNLFDRKYWRWNDVRGVLVADGDARIDALSAPGRNYNVALKVDF